MNTISYRVLSRRIGQSIKIKVPGGSNEDGMVEIHIDLNRIDGDLAKIGVEAPMGVSIIEPESVATYRDAVVLER